MSLVSYVRSYHGLFSRKSLGFQLNWSNLRIERWGWEIETDKLQVSINVDVEGRAKVIISLILM